MNDIPDVISYCNIHAEFYNTSSICHKCFTMLGPSVAASNGSGVKYDQGKPAMDLLSSEALTQIAAVMSYGAGKYGRHNWRGGMLWSRVIGAALRHLTAFNDGVDIDPETKLSHLAHAGCCIHFLLEYEKSHKDKDDRYKREKK